MSDRFLLWIESTSDETTHTLSLRVSESISISDLDVYLESGSNGNQQLLITTANGGKQTFPVDLKVSNCDVSASFSKRSRTLTVKVGLLQPVTTSTTTNKPTLPLPISTSSKSHQSNATTSTAPIPSTPRQSADSELELSHSPDSLKEQDHHPSDSNPEAAGNKKKKKKKKKRKSKATTTEEGEETSLDDLSQQQEDQDKTAAPPPSPKGTQKAKQDDNNNNLPPNHHLDPTPPVVAAAAVPNALKGTTVLGGGEVASEHSPSSLTNGPVTKDAIAKDRCRDRSKGGEDQWLMKPHNTWKLRISNSNGEEEEEEGEEDSNNKNGGGSFVSTSFSAFGVFDGHGGKQVATFASNMILKNTMAIIDSGSTAHVPDLHQLPTTDLPSSSETAAGIVDVGVWQAQTAFIDRLPQALVQAFIQTDKESHKRFNHGGTTATVAVLCGWELVVANVGDSLAYLDTGTEVLCVCGNHRLADSPAEVKRIEDSGGEVASSTVNGKPAGPIRVWPGGLAMARSIGDVDAGARVLGEPDVRQVTIPSGGARLIIASDGLWDAVKPKNAAHHTRDMGASEAAHKLLAQAIKKDHLKDDVTVVVVDILPSEHDKSVPNMVAGSSSSISHASTLLSSTNTAPTTTTRLAVVRNPLQEDIDFLSAGAHRRSEVLAALEAAELERKEAEARAEERRREKEEEEEKAAKGHHQHGIGNNNNIIITSGNGGSGLYAELSNLKLTPEDVQSATWKTTTDENKGGNRNSPSKQQQRKKKKPPPKRKEAVVNEGAENKGHVQEHEQEAAPSSSHDLNQGGDDRHTHGRSGHGGGRGRGRGEGKGRGGGNAMHADTSQPPSVEGVSKSSNTTTFIRKRGGGHGGRGGRGRGPQHGTATSIANVQQQQA